MEFYDKYNKYKTKYLELKQFYNDFYGAGPKKAKGKDKGKDKGNDKGKDKEKDKGKDKSKGIETPSATPRKEVPPQSEYITVLPNEGDSIYLIYHSTEPKIGDEHPFTIKENILDKNLNFFYINVKKVNAIINISDTSHDIEITPIIYIKNKNIIQDMVNDSQLAIKTFMDELKKPLSVSVKYDQAKLGKFFKDIVHEMKEKIQGKIKLINKINDDIQKYLNNHKNIPIANYNLYKFKSIELGKKTPDVILIDDTTFTKKDDNIIFGKKKNSMK
jgi:hypothetical protein